MLLGCRSIGVFDKKDKDEGAKQEREEEEHKQGVAKHDVFGMSIKAKDVGDDGDVRALDTSMQVQVHQRHSAVRALKCCTAMCSLAIPAPMTLDVAVSAG